MGHTTPNRPRPYPWVTCATRATPCAGVTRGPTPGTLTCRENRPPDTRPPDTCRIICTFQRILYMGFRGLMQLLPSASQLAGVAVPGEALLVATQITYVVVGTAVVLGRAVRIQLLGYQYSALRAFSPEAGNAGRSRSTQSGEPPQRDSPPSPVTCVTPVTPDLSQRPRAGDDTGCGRCRRPRWSRSPRRTRP